MMNQADPVMTVSQMDELIDRAIAAGKAAHDRHTPVPMNVYEADVFGRKLPGGQSWRCDEGVCGFAWVTFRPGNSKLANRMKKRGLARAAYGGGVQYRVSTPSQSLERKEAYAHAMSKVFNDAGFSRVYSGSRMD